MFVDVQLSLFFIVHTWYVYEITEKMENEMGSSEIKIIKGTCR